MRSDERLEFSADELPLDYTGVSGLDHAIHLARSRRIISAIKHLEATNPRLSRSKATEIVHYFGYGRDLRWPELERAFGAGHQSIRSL